MCLPECRITPYNDAHSQLSVFRKIPVQNMLNFAHYIIRWPPLPPPYFRGWMGGKSLVLYHGKYVLVMCFLLVHTTTRSELSAALPPMAKVAAFYINTEDAFSVFSNIISKMFDLIWGNSAYCYKGAMWNMQSGQIFVHTDWLIEYICMISWKF